jgi:hypothetical protein
MVEVVEHLLCKCEELSSNSSPTKKKKEQLKTWVVCEEGYYFPEWSHPSLAPTLHKHLSIHPCECALSGENKLKTQHSVLSPWLAHWDKIKCWLLRRLFPPCQTVSHSAMALPLLQSPTPHAHTSAWHPPPCIVGRCSCISLLRSTRWDFPLGVSWCILQLHRTLPSFSDGSSSVCGPFIYVHTFQYRTSSI